MTDYLIAETAEDYRNAAMLFQEYAAWLNIDLGFQHFEEELDALQTMYAKPEGGIILCQTTGGMIGCVGIRKINDDTAELKRMYIKPAFQNRGMGKQLLQKAIELACSLHYKSIRLDTLDHMTAAINLYKKFGFCEIPAYYHNPNKNALYFELKC